MLSKAEQDQETQPGNDDPSQVTPVPNVGSSFFSRVITVVINIIQGFLNVIQMIVNFVQAAREMMPILCCCHGCCCCLCNHILHPLCFCSHRVMPLVRQFAVFAVKWIRYSWFDIATILTTTTTAGILFQLYLSKPPASRSFAVMTQNNDVVYPQFAFPLRDEILPSWLAILLGPFVPVVILLALQLYVRSFWDANNAIFGVLYSLSNSVVFQVIIKWLIGGLRPHFLDVCKPDLSLAKTLDRVKSPYNAAGFNNMYYTREICTGDPRLINDALSSMPSGHTTAAFAGFVFLSLYLNGKLKIFSNQHMQMWKMMLFYFPILVATLIGGALTIDAFHNWYDILAGAIIGTTMAFSAYRMTYAAVFDYRYNHIPLNRNRPFDYDAIKPGLSGFTHLDNSRF
ncbi:hypothetical protein SEUCBS139899_006616 [Sporothrix eucalyptigena]|uniref:Phosphatidic acid phosphatase type 2/haloperoxidase domain-containing protein n=1 Tax=Sporothrix eucalyptigena TaxID=1812306 RepID=A0ABP0B2B6_9PEZI